MSKVHITLVGAQAAPVYNGIVATEPDYVIFICSDDSEKTVKAVVAEIDIPNEKILISPTNPIEIAKIAKQLADRFNEDEVILNISSGLKSWSHLFGVEFDKMPNATVIYIDQNNVLWNYTTMQGSYDIEFDMLTHFRLYGNPIDGNFKRLEDYTDEDMEILKTIENIRNFNPTVFNRLCTVLPKGQQNILKNSVKGKFADEQTSSYVEWQKNKGEQKGNVHIYMTKKEKHIDKTLSSKNVLNILFNSGWFELKVAKLLSAWPKCKEVCLNCRFPFRTKIDKNEVDIIVNTGTKVLFVECKTQITTTTDIDKFRTVIKTYGGMGSKGLFVTDAKMDDMAKAKCEEHKILTFSLQDELLGISTEKALQLLLNSELENINTK